SRRRHTRSKRDWSSDVCSSDLLRGPLACREFYWRKIEDFIAGRQARLGSPGDHRHRTTVVSQRGREKPYHKGYVSYGRQSSHPRSEERRVGKECRSRMVTGHVK